MREIASKVMRATQLQTRLGQVFWHRTTHAWEQYMDRSRAAMESATTAQPEVAGRQSAAWHEYTLDFLQRGVLFWDTLRRRGNQYLEHEIAGKPP
ncbi:MAG TPA: hypothetical protein VG963_33475, partial [Polyangiaceae bacterium]|nr:hypothetical protein [Polyangiaceae bacterium]